MTIATKSPTARRSLLQHDSTTTVGIEGIDEALGPALLEEIYAPSSFINITGRSAMLCCGTTALSCIVVNPLTLRRVA